MSISNLIEEMNDYYRDRVPYHDYYMGYKNNLAMEKLLAPLIERIEDEITNKDILEIACGTGNWTQVLAKRAHSVVAVDFYEGYLDEAKKKNYQKDNVTFLKADAYRLDDINGDFNVAFAADWFSHIPKSRIGQFIRGLHNRMLPNSRVILIDMMKNTELDKMFSHIDEEGNVIQNRVLPNGKEYKVIKNFPSELELLDNFVSHASEISYYNDKGLLRWVLTYTVIL
jgi:demethylmenaquinone methyltransferase/2-methoxy-6-polyprenyl-1,4-benzoquinol methylase